jgi:cobalt-precorrin 5A hydrolase
VKKKIGIWIVRQEAEKVALKLSQSLGGSVYKPWTVTDSHKGYFQSVFTDQEAWVLVMACGIAVRFVDGLLHDKLTDPAVVVLDEAGRNVISLSGGHEGGANELAYAVANCLGANPVITTASDVLKPLVIGIGCKRGITSEQIKTAVLEVLDGRPLSEVRELATIELKKDEPGLVEFCTSNKIPLRWFSKDDVAGRVWVGKPSPWVLENVGVEGVCEPVALMANSRGKLWREKTNNSGISIAIVEDIPLVATAQKVKKK